MQDFTELARQWHRKYGLYETDFPATAHFVIPWREQISATIALLVDLERVYTMSGTRMEAMTGDYPNNSGTPENLSG
jgi:hypothetical protein